MEIKEDRQESPSRDHFGTSAKRNASCIVVRSKRQPETYSLVVSISTRWDTQLLQIDPQSGRLLFRNRKGADVFDTEGEALDVLSAMADIEIMERGCALLGYVPIGNVGMLLLATRLRNAATLPGGHIMRLVTESRWMQIPLPESGQRLTPEEMDRVDMMPKFTLNNAHYFCETADITRPFPSTHSVEDPSWEFVWNRWLAASLRNIGLSSHCPHLLQGVVESRTLEDNRGLRYTLVLFSRRSRLHPGMRYIARGLNSLASPGNEIECEQLVWLAPQSPNAALSWSSYVWRRGTVPIWWGVEIKSGGVGEATIVVSADRPYNGTGRYFRRLQKRYSPGSRGKTDVSNGEAADKDSSELEGVNTPVTCINLLRCNMQRKDELLLSEHFSEGLRTVRKRLPGAPLRVINFDWHGMVKDLREKGAVEGLWALLETIVSQSDISVGTLEPAETPAQGERDAAKRVESGAEASTSATSPWGDEWKTRWSSRQCGVVRYNCADSLDRTNAASYFGAVQVLSEQCRRLGIDIEASSAHIAALSEARGTARKKPAWNLDISSIHRRIKEDMRSSQRAKTNSPAPSDPPPYSGDSSLPPGWEARRDEVTGREFFIDHNSRKTTWVRPALPLPPPSAATPDSNTPSGVSPEGSSGDLAAAAEAASEAAAEAVAAEQGVPAAAGKAEDHRFGLFGLSVDEVRSRLRPDLVAQHAEIFLINGDMNSNLYTSSRAMHSAILSLLQPDGSGMSKAGVGRLQNISVSVQRRWNNVLSDATRQTIVELFLGLRLPTYFPSARLPLTDTLPLDEDSDGAESDADEPFIYATRAQGLSPELVNQHTLLEASGYTPVEEEAPASGPWQQIGQEPGHILDQLTLSEVQQATQQVIPTSRGDLPLTAIGSGAQMRDLHL
ncbi:probable phosphoinositide phosphatase SAC9 [Coccomyxa sp. Obi]|nr:probable phosphoinositide phosphatase SAC9 [Coccomyxa sp. Obi]